jgi:hypothetical protein
MRWAVLWALALCLAASASALTPSTSNVFRPEQEPSGQEGERPPGRVQGDTVADPFFVFFDCEMFSASGNTCGYVNDYDYACPYTGSTSADVVYKLVCSSNTVVSIDLCASTYDTKVYVYENTVGNVIACNDDFCSFQSKVGNVPLTVGNTYYIVVDGYGGSCGNYELVISQYAPCVLTCPPGAMLEGEPDCYDGYNDTYNGGCNITPFPVFQILEPTGEDITICGTTGVYQYGTLLYRDTDWYQMDITQTSNICLSGNSEVPYYFFIIDGRGGCANSAIVAYGGGGICWPVSDICYTCGPGTWWAWAGPSAWDHCSVCGSTYLMTISGYDVGGTPVESTTWGRVKSMFR